MRFPSGAVEKFLDLEVVVALHCECIKCCCRIVYFKVVKMVSFIFCELYFNLQEESKVDVRTLRRLD